MPLRRAAGRALRALAVVVAEAVPSVPAAAEEDFREVVAVVSAAAVAVVDEAAVAAGAPTSR